MVHNWRSLVGLVVRCALCVNTPRVGGLLAPMWANKSPNISLLIIMADCMHSIATTCAVWTLITVWGKEQFSHHNELSCRGARSVVHESLALFQLVPPLLLFKRHEVQFLQIFWVVELAITVLLFFSTHPQDVFFLHGC